MKGAHHFHPATNLAVEPLGGAVGAYVSSVLSREPRIGQGLRAAVPDNLRASLSLMELSSSTTSKALASEPDDMKLKVAAKVVKDGYDVCVNDNLP